MRKVYSMKIAKAILAILIIFSTSKGYAQYVAIPDSNFGYWLNAIGYSSCMIGNSSSGWHLDTTCPQVINATRIDCYYQNIRDFTGVKYFKNLTSLYCAGNLMDSLPNLPSSVTALDISENQFTALPNLPNTLQSLGCRLNSFTSLAQSHLPDSLKSLDCWGCGLTSLPTLPSGLSWLICSYNILTTLPALPSGLSVLDCSHNQLTSLPDLPEVMRQFDCSYNRSLTCFPEMHKITYSFRFDSTAVTCFTNYPRDAYDQYFVLNTSPYLFNYPLCDTGNSNHCAPTMCNTIRSILYDSVCHGGRYLYHGRFFMPGSYNYDTLVSSMGCDSIVNLILTTRISSPTYIVVDSVHPPTGTNISDGYICIHTEGGLADYDYYWSNSTYGQLIYQHCDIGLPGGRYTVQSIDTNLCMSDTMAFTLTPQNAAGPDQTIRTGDTISMGAYGIGVWTIVGTNPTTAIFSNDSSYNTMVTGFTQPGIYTFAWTVGSISDTMQVYVGTIPLNYVLIPDTNFGKILNSTYAYSSCMTGSSHSGWYMDTTCNSILTSTYLNLTTYSSATNSWIEQLTGVQYFKSLRQLYCNGNHLTYLPPLPDSLKILNCGYNQLVNLPVLPNGLLTLYCDSNHLSTLPTLPASLTEISCSFNWLNALPNLPDSLITLYCNNNNSLTGLPPLPARLQKLYCHHDQLTSIPSLPNSLRELYCYNNQLNSLPPLLGSLLRVECYYNQLTSLPSMSNSITNLFCYGNLLTSLPALSNSLLNLSCFDNPLSSLPVLPNSLLGIDCRRTNLHCLPQLPLSLYDIYIDTSLIKCLPRRVHLVADNNGWTVNNYPICTSGNINNCPVYIPTAGPDQNICKSDTLTMAGTGGGRWTSLAGNPSVVYFANSISSDTRVTGLDSAGTYTFIYSDQPFADTMQVIVAICTRSTDSIWPGDVDRSRLVDLNDLLPLGILYGKTGPARSIVDIAWSPHYAVDWAADTFGYSFNDKYADCNGDGVIDANDTMAISQNYGLIHAKGNGNNPSWRSGIPTLSVKFDRDTMNNGDTLTISVILGDFGTVVQSIYGLAFTLHYDPLYVDMIQPMIFRFGNSWLGNAANSISMTRISPSTAQVRSVITGIDHLSRSGYGEIARFSYIVNTTGIQNHNTQYLTNTASISDETAIDKNGHSLSLNVGTDSNVVISLPNGINEVPGNGYIRLYPNPANDLVQIISDRAMTAIVITDILGQIVMSRTPDHKQAETMDISMLKTGIYFVQVSGGGISKTARLVVRK